MLNEANKHSESLSISEKLKNFFALINQRRDVIAYSSIIIILAIIIFRNWLFTSEWPAGGDIVGWISREYLYGSERWLYTWRPHSFGFPETINSMDLFLAITHLIFRDPAATVKAFSFTLFLISALSSYLFTYNYIKNHTAAFCGSLVYVFNQWFFSQFTEGHIDIVFSYALAPLIFLSLDRVLEDPKPKRVLLLSLGLAVLITGFHPEFIVIYGIFLVLFVIFHIAAKVKREGIRKISLKRSTINLTVLVALTAFLIAFTIFPMFFGSSPPYYSREYKYYIEETYGLSYTTLADAFTLMFVEKGGYDQLITDQTDIGLYNFPYQEILLFIYLLAYSAFFIRKDAHMIFFAFATIISTLLSLGPHSPIKEAFVWAWFNVPHFAVYRAIDRWISMTAFSHSFFVALFVGMILNFVKKENQSKNNYFYKAIKKILSKFSILLITLTLVCSIFSSFFFLRHGLQTYTPPGEYLAPFNWIATQPGDYRVIPVAKSHEEWIGISGLTDFSSAGMLTPVGWSHDIGYDSPFIHNKPTLQDGGWSPLARAFVDRFRFKLVREKLTDDLLKIFGTFNFKYVVIPPYVSDEMRTFFVNQEGAEICYEEDGSIILRNKYFTPHIFGSYNKALVIGGLDSFSSLSEIPSFNLTSTPLIFANQLDEETLKRIFLQSNYTIFVNTDLTDLTLTLLKDKSILIRAADYAAPSYNAEKYWIKSAYWRYLGAYMIGRETLSTKGENSVNIPFKVPSTDIYDLWIKIGFAPSRGKLQLLIDGELKAEITPYQKFWETLKWLNVTRIHLTEGEHTLTLKNDGKGYNDINAIEIVKPAEFKNAMNEALDLFGNYNGETVLLIEAENTESIDWSPLSMEYEGQMIYVSKFGPNIALNAEASASSIEVIGLEPDKAVDGSPSTRWSSSKGMPQWIELKWPSIQEIRGISILFEKALAIDYSVEIWDGEKWIEEVKVMDNNSTNRLHDFTEPVKTDRLRIYVTRAKLPFNTVSIFEVKVYQNIQKVSWPVKFWVPKDGFYNFALRSAVGPNLGDLYITIGNQTYEFSCLSNTLKFENLEAGPFFLKKGEQSINVTASGGAIIDKAVLYLNREGDKELSLKSLFSDDEPYITYIKKNPCEYIVHVKTTKPFILVLSNSHHPLWKAYIDGEEVSPLITYYFVNGYLINRTGEFELTLFFEGQKYADLGLKVSLIALTIVLAILAIPSRYLEKLRRLKRISRQS